MLSIIISHSLLTINQCHKKKWTTANGKKGRGKDRQKIQETGKNAAKENKHTNNTKLKHPVRTI